MISAKAADVESVRTFIGLCRDTNVSPDGLGCHARNMQMADVLERVLQSTVLDDNSVLMSKEEHDKITMALFIANRHLDKIKKMEASLKECTGTIKLLYREQKSEDILRTCNAIMDRAAEARGVVRADCCPQCKSPGDDVGRNGTIVCDVCGTEWMK